MREKQQIDFIDEPAKKVPIAFNADVIVAGAGVAGTYAALASQSTGAKTVLVDRFGVLGGNVGPGMIIAGSGPFHDGSVKLLKEFTHRMQALRDMNNNLDFSNIFSYTAFKMAEETGLKLVLSSYAADPIVKDKKIQGLYVEGKSGRIAIKAPVIIDATGDASIAARAGCPVVYDVPPDPSHGHVIRKLCMKDDFNTWNELGINCVIDRVDYDRYRKSIAEGLISDENFVKTSQEINIDGMEGRITRKIVFAAPGAGFNKMSEGLVSGMFQFWGEINTGDMFHISKVESELRVRVFEYIENLRNTVPGFEEAYIVCTSPFLGARGGPFIEGEYSLQPEDSFTGKLFDDVVYHSYRECVYGGDERGYDVPYRVFLPQNIEGILVTGRGESYVRRGHDPNGMRSRYSKMRSGTVVGIAAAMSVANQISPNNLNVKTLQKELIRNGFYLGDEERLKELELFK